MLTRNKNGVIVTDKTKPWLTAKHPEAIACKAAGKRLYQELKDSAVDLTGVGVRTTDDNQNACISIMLRNAKDAAKVPATYNGFEVKVSITGNIVAQ